MTPTPRQPLAERQDAMVEFDDEAGVDYTIAKLREELAELYARPIDENAEKGRRTAIYQKGPSIIGRLQHIDHLQRYKIAFLEHRLTKALNPPKHRFWGAGEPNCPREIKAGNGELHTLRCKVCGQDDPRDNYCRAGAHP